MDAGRHLDFERHARRRAARQNGFVQRTRLSGGRRGFAEACFSGPQAFGRVELGETGSPGVWLFNETQSRIIFR
jgi:hypothetical protein